MAHPTPTETLFTHEATLPIRTDATWHLLRDFGTWDKWCPLYTNMRITNGQAGKVGAIRKYTIIVGNSTYEEKLTELDDAHTTLGFELLTSNPAVPGLVGISHRIILKSVNNGDGTFIQRLTTNKTIGMAPEFIEAVKGKQLKSYDTENAVLQARVSAQKMIMDGMSFFNDNVIKLTQAIMTGQSTTWEYDEYPDWMGYLPKMVKGLPISEVLPAHKLGDMLTRFIELVYQQAGAYIKAQISPQQAQTTGNIYELETLGLVLSGHAEPRGLKELTAYLIHNWESDVEFCQQTLQGLNPMHIKLVDSLEEVPDVLQSLTAKDHSGTKTVKQLIGEKRLFILDYRELANFSLCNFTPKTYFTAPVLLAYREIVDDHNSRLNVLGIQLHPSRNEIFTPQMKQHNRYKLARMFVACADTQYHEFRYHLGIAHMGMEPFAVSTHNRLPKRDDFTHPLRLMLAPHLEGTIGIAWFARQTLIAEKDAFTDKTFALGTKQGILLASDGWRKYDFFKSSFPEQLKARGFDEAGTDGLKDYHYRDDGFKLWNLIGEYTTSAVNTFYKDDAAVADDGDLQMWADETASKDGGNIPGFPSSITTKKDLAHVLQIIIWNGSAQHSVINYPQAPYQTLVPSRPNAMYQPMPDLPEDGSDISDEYLKSALASEFPMLFQLLFTWLLSLPADSNLLNLKAFGTKYPELDVAFHNKMVALTEELNKRNEQLSKSGKAPYIYLLPENVACSVNI